MWRKNLEHSVLNGITLSNPFLQNSENIMEERLKDYKRQKELSTSGAQGPLNQLTKAHMNSQRLKQLHGPVPVSLCIDYSLQFSFRTELLSVSEWISDFVPFLRTFFLLLVFFIQCYYDGFVLSYYILLYYLLEACIWHRSEYITIGGVMRRNWEE